MRAAPIPSLRGDARLTTPLSPSKSSRGSTPSPPRQDLLESVGGLHQHGIFDSTEKLWTRSLSLRRGGTVVVVEDYAKADSRCDGSWCALSSHLSDAHCTRAWPDERGLLRRTLFPAAIVLARYMEAARLLHPGSAPLVTVELGCGSGVVSMVAAALGARAIATDQPSELAYARRNVKMNQRLLELPSTGTCVVRPLEWGVADHIEAVSGLVQKPLKFPTEACVDGQMPTRTWTTLLVGADITYRPDSFEILAKTLSCLSTASAGAARIWLSHDDASETQISGVSGREVFFGKPVPEPQPQPEPEPEPEPKPESESEPAIARRRQSHRASELARKQWMPGLCEGGIVQNFRLRCRRLATNDALPKEWQYPSVFVYELWAG